MLFSATMLLTDFAVKGLIILGITAFATLCLRRKSAATVHVVWTLGFIALLVVPTVGLMLPQRGFKVVSSLATKSWPQAPVNSSDVNGFRKQRELLREEQLPRSATVHAQSEAIEVTRGYAPTEFNRGRSPNDATDAVQRPALLLPHVPSVVMAWALIALLLLSRLAIHQVALSRLLNRCVPLAEEEWVNSIAEAARHLGLARHVRLVVHSAATMPATAGAWRPTILLPADVRNWTASRRRSVLLHELAHIKRFDVFFQLLASVACAIHWFNPLAWRGLAQMRTLRELACDDLVLAGGQRPTDYAQTLMEIARDYHPRRLAPVVGMARGTNVEYRIMAILDAARNRVPLSRRATATLMVFVMSAIVVIGSVRLEIQAANFADRSASPNTVQTATQMKPDTEQSTVAKTLSPSPLPTEASPAPPLGGGTAIDGFGDPLPPGAKLRLGTVRLRMDGYVEGVAFSPNGKLVVTTGRDDSIRIWDVNSGKLIRRLIVDELDHTTYAAAFSPDGGKIVSVSDRGFVRLWDARSGQLLSKTLGHTEHEFGANVYGVAFSPNGRTFATAGSDKPVCIWDAANGTKLKELQSDSGGSDARPVAYSRDSKLLASGDQNGTIQIWNLAEGSAAKIIPKAHQRDIVALAFTKDGSFLISCGNRFQRTGERSGRLVSQIHVWDVATGEKQAGFEAGEELAGYCTLAISPDGSILASAHDKKIVVWDAEKRVPITFIRDEKLHFGGRTHLLAVSPDNSLVATGVANIGSDKVYLWNLTTGQAVLPQMDTHVQAILATDMSPDGSLLVTGSADGAVRLWDAKSGKHIRLIDQGSGWVRYVQFFPDGQSIALGRETYTVSKPKIEGEVKVCRTADARVVHHWPVPDRVMCGAVSHGGGQKLAVGIGLGIESGPGFGEKPDLAKILVWDTQTGNKINETSGSPSQFQQLRFTDDGSELWSTSADLLTRKWSMSKTEEIDSYPLSTADLPARFNNWSLIIPGTSRLLQRGIKASLGKLTVTDFEKDKIVWEKTFQDSWPREFAVSANGTLMAAFLYPLSGSKGKKRVAVLAADDGRELLSLGLPDGTVRSLAFSPDAKLLFTGMDASDVLVWELPSGVNTAQSTVRQ